MAQNPDHDSHMSNLPFLFFLFLKQEAERSEIFNTCPQKMFLGVGRGLQFSNGPDNSVLSLKSGPRENGYFFLLNVNNTSKFSQA